MPECPIKAEQSTSTNGGESRSVQAVLWDFDGVIARTENLHIAAWQRVVRHVEIKLPRNAFDRAASDDDRDLIYRAFDQMGIRLHAIQVRAWCANKQAILVDLLKTAPPIYPNVPQCMRALADMGLRQGVVTSTWRANVEATLGHTDLLDMMEFVIAKEDVARPKPWPDGYRLAVQRLGLAPGQCVAFEDSPSGLASARSAGVGVLAVAHPFSPAALRSDDWTGGARVLSGFSDLSHVLSALEMR